MNAESTQPTLESILIEEARCSESLQSCLDAERSALTTRDMNALQSTTREKLDYTRKLEALEQQRGALLTQQGFDTDAEGLQDYIQRQSRSKALAALWQRILNNIEACRNGNLTNGSILESGRLHVEQALCILRGQSGKPALYSPAGSAPTDLGQRKLGKV